MALRERVAAGLSAAIREPPFGPPPNPAKALARAAAAIARWFVLEEPASRTRAHLRSVDPELPDVDLSLVRDGRLFSRTLPLVVEATVSGTGPDHPFSLQLRRSRIRKESTLRPAGAAGPEASAWAGRFAAEGLLRGVSTMTGVQDLRLSWDPAGGRWSLRLQTLAGGLIGTAPSSAIVVELEPEDVAGLLDLLRAFRRAALSPP